MNYFNFFPPAVRLRWQDMQIIVFTLRKVIKIFVALMGFLVLIIKTWQRETESGFFNTSKARLPAT